MEGCEVQSAQRYRCQYEFSEKYCGIVSITPFVNPHPPPTHRFETVIIYQFLNIQQGRVVSLYVLYTLILHLLSKPGNLFFLSREIAVFTEIVKLWARNEASKKKSPTPLGPFPRYPCSPPNGAICAFEQEPVLVLFWSKI